MVRLPPVWGLANTQSPSLENVLKLWCRSAVNCSFFLVLAACRMRSSAWYTLARFCARHVLCWVTFPSVSALGSIRSAAGEPALFADFFATMAESDFP